MDSRHRLKTAACRHWCRRSSLRHAASRLARHPLQSSCASGAYPSQYERRRREPGRLAAGEAPVAKRRVGTRRQAARIRAEGCLAGTLHASRLARHPSPSGAYPGGAMSRRHVARLAAGEAPCKAHAPAKSPAQPPSVTRIRAGGGHTSDTGAPSLGDAAGAQTPDSDSDIMTRIRRSGAARRPTRMARLGCSPRALTSPVHEPPPRIRVAGDLAPSAISESLHTTDPVHQSLTRIRVAGIR